MIRISNGPISITKKIDDRWGRPTRYWSVNEWGYVTDERFFELLEFESYVPAFPRAMLEEVLKKRLKWSGGVTCYQFNASRGRDEYIRMIAILNNKDKDKLRRTSWIEAYIKYPIYSMICKIANRLIINDEV